MSTCTTVDDVVGGLTKGESLKYTLIGQGEAKPRKFYKFWEGGGKRFAIPNNDMRTVLHAIVERVFYVKLGGVFQRPPAFTTSKKRFAVFKDGLTSILGNLSPCSAETFCARYTGNKFRLYTNAAESLLTDTLEWKDSWIRAFTKAEYLKPNGCPRLIQPRSPRYNVCLGCYLSPNEKTILHGVDQLFTERWGDSNKTVAKGMNFSERGKVIASMWADFDDPVCIGFDAARFDQHINESLLELEHSIYLKLFSDTNSSIGEVKLSTLLKWQRRNICSWNGPEGKVIYKTKGCRMSGDMNTSLGNILVMTMLWYTYREEKGYDFRLLNDGDDSCIICSRTTAAKIQEDVQDFFTQCGITMVVEGIFNTLEDITFCQAKPVFDGENYYLCPNPHKRLFSDLTTMKDMTSAKTFNMQLGSIAACGLAANGSTPVLNTLYRRMGTGVELFIPDRSHHLYRFRQELVEGMTPIFKQPTWKHRISFYHAFDITPAEQLALEKFYNNLPCLKHQFCDKRQMAFAALSLLDPVYVEHEHAEGVDADKGRRISTIATPITTKKYYG